MVIVQERLAVAHADEMRVTTRRVGDHRIHVVDGFFEDPQYVRDLGLSLTFSSNPDLVGGYPGQKAMVSVDNSSLSAASALLLYCSDGWAILPLSTVKNVVKTCQTAIMVSIS